MIAYLMAALLGASWAAIAYEVAPWLFPPDVVLLMCHAGQLLGLAYMLLLAPPRHRSRRPARRAA